MKHRHLTFTLQPDWRAALRLAGGVVCPFVGVHIDMRLQTSQGMAT